MGRGRRWPIPYCSTASLHDRSEGGGRDLPPKQQEPRKQGQARHWRGGFLFAATGQVRRVRGENLPRGLGVNLVFSLGASRWEEKGKWEVQAECRRWLAA